MMRKYNLSSICKAANRFHAQGYSRSTAFVLAWRLAKETAQTGVSGTTHGDGQSVLAALVNADPSTVTVELHRERENLYDSNAVTVFIREGEYLHKLGYIPARAAACIAPLMDAGQRIVAHLTRIVGGWADGISYGARLALAM